MVKAMNPEGNDDPSLTPADVKAIKAAARKMRRLGLGAIFVTSVVGAGLMYLVVLRQGNEQAAHVVAAVFLGLGAWVFIDWWRRYRRILGEIERMERRMSRGGECPGPPAGSSRPGDIQGHARTPES